MESIFKYTLLGIIYLFIAASIVGIPCMIWTEFFKNEND